MKTTNIHLVTKVDPDSKNLVVLAGSTQYDLITEQFDNIVMSTGESFGLKIVTIKLPEIILTGDESVIDLTEQVHNDQ